MGILSRKGHQVVSNNDVRSDDDNFEIYLFLRDDGYVDARLLGKDEAFRAPVNYIQLTYQVESPEILAIEFDDLTLGMQKGYQGALELVRKGDQEALVLVNYFFTGLMDCLYARLNPRHDEAEVVADILAQRPLTIRPRANGLLTFAHDGDDLVCYFSIGESGAQPNSARQAKPEGRAELLDAIRALAMEVTSEDR